MKTRLTLKPLKHASQPMQPEPAAPRINYTVGTLRAAGLSAKWGRNSAGAPLLFARDDSKGRAWYAVGRDMWKDMQAEGIKPAFERHTLLGDLFSLPA